MYPSSMLRLAGAWTMASQQHDFGKFVLFIVGTKEKAKVSEAQ
jgi:hypothetical protein